MRRILPSKEIAWAFIYTNLREAGAESAIYLINCGLQVALPTLGHFLF